MSFCMFHTVSGILFKVVNGLKHVLILSGLIISDHSDAFLTYGMTILHLGVSFSFFSSPILLVLAASILLDIYYSSKPS